MEDEQNISTSFATLTMLEERLHRLEFLLHGSSDAFGVPDPVPTPAGREDSVSERLAGLESSLSRLASKYGSVQDILDLRELSPHSNICTSTDHVQSHAIQSSSFQPQMTNL
jgi:hypothetical protein